MFGTWKRFFYSGARFCSECNFKWKPPSGFKTNIVVYNPISKIKTPLILRNNNVATWYMCGPTVYDSSHIGHACTYVKFDIIRRIMAEFFDINVVLVMGLTDIDDKIINRSNQCGQNWQSLTQHYENEYFSDMDSLNVLRPFLTCRVSNYIPEIIEFVKKIVDKNGAYIGKDGSVYFDSSNYKNYGKLDLLKEGEPHPDKKSSLDFALWKASKENEPYWESPWGRGRPGWHIECSAIASTVLGNNIDIHSGGIDLAFPHHENEEAQSCCYHDVDQWVNYWMHTGHLNIEENVKMSKSLNNTISISNFLKSHTANQLRMLCLLTHYRNNIQFSKEIFNQANAFLKKIEFFISDCNDYIYGKCDTGNIDEIKLLNYLEKTRSEVILAFSDDFHTPRAMQAIANLISITNRMLKAEKTIKVQNTASIAAVSNYIKCTISKLGISNALVSKNHMEMSKIINILVDFRHEIRTNALKKNIQYTELLKACDNVRKNLSDNGVDIRDKEEAASWTLRAK